MSTANQGMLTFQLREKMQDSETFSLLGAVRRIRTDIWFQGIWRASPNRLRSPTFIKLLEGASSSNSQVPKTTTFSETATEYYLFFCLLICVGKRTPKDSDNFFACIRSELLTLTQLAFDLSVTQIITQSVFIRTLPRSPVFGVALASESVTTTVDDKDVEALC